MSGIITLMKYYIWTAGCQMNVADSRRTASALEKMGYTAAEEKAADADVIVVNTCMVRQSAEDKAYNYLNSLRAKKKENPNATICLMGCMVGNRKNDALVEKLPWVDVFAPPSDPSPLIDALLTQDGISSEADYLEKRNAILDGDLVLTDEYKGNLVSDYVPIVLGCSHACAYCIIPYRRGKEISRPADVILEECQALLDQGVKEITLLGQIVDRYGLDLENGESLAWLLRKVHDLPGLERLRFLTSHPKYMTDDLLDAVAELPKLMNHIEVPVQAGDDEVLENMRRGYTNADYRALVKKIRERIPNVSIGTDIIVGFPGETDEQFQVTYDLLEDLRVDVAHLARYSSRPGTLATRKMVDNVTDEEKWRRFRLLEDQQKRIVGELNEAYLGQTVPVLFEEKVRGRWRGRTETMRLVFTESEEDLRGQLVDVEIVWTGPWSMQGKLLS